MATESISIGFLGGTGPAGRGLGIRFALAGEQVLVGSRDEARADEAAKSVLAKAPGTSVSGLLNEDIPARADIVFITVPYAAQRQTIEPFKGQLDGKIVVDTVSPLIVTDGVASTVSVAEGSAALEAQAVLSEAAVVAAFHTISARELLVPERRIDSDVLVCADDPEAKGVVMRLAEKIDGVRAVDGGGLENARYVEGLVALLLNMRRLYKARPSIKIVGI